MRNYELKNRRFDFLGLNFHNYSMPEVVEKLKYFIKSKTPHMVSTITAELAVRASKNQALKEIYNKADLLTIDSFILYYAACLFRKPAARPVHATRLAFKFLPIMNDKAYRLYVLGAKEEVVQRAVLNLKSQYPRIDVVGFHHGYFNFENDQEIVEEIKKQKPDVLFVAMSSPLKENFIAKNLKEMNVPVCIAVGGGVDIMAGESRLAPLRISKMGLEWFYRLIQEPGRMWKRYTLVNAQFLYLLVRELFKKREQVYEGS